jgi:hypothetical protein
MIDREELARLAAQYDRYAHALDPFSEEQLKAKRQFLAALEMLHVREGGQSLDFESFRYDLVRRCKEYLRKN